MQKQLISQLSPTLESKSVFISERGLTSTTWSEYSGGTKRTQYSTVPTSSITAEVVTVDGFTLSQKDSAGITTTATRSYTANGMVLSQTDGRGNTTSTITDIAGRTTSVTDAAGNVITTVYCDCCDQPALVTDAMGNTSHYRYDARGRKVAEWGTAIQPVVFGYDDADQLVSLTTFRGAPETNADGSPSRSGEGAAAGDTTTWTFDPATGLELSKTYADNTCVVKSYDAHNRLATETNARGRVKVHSYEPARGLLLNTTWYYPAAEDEEAVADSYSPSRSFTYNHLGQLTQVTDAAGIRTIGYNQYGEQETDSLVVDNDTHLITETRDALGRSTGYVYSKNGAAQQTVTTGYGTDGRIASAGFLHGGAEKLFSYEYLPGTHLLQKLTLPSNMTLTQSYEPQRDLLTGMCYKRSNTTVAERTYTYDALGRPLTRTTSRDVQSVTDSFGYNNRSELTTATVNNGAYAYDYDNIGNRKTAQENAEEVTGYQSNELNQYTAISVDGAIDFAPEYDADGNQTRVKTSTGIWAVNYDSENRPIDFYRIDSTGGTTVHCTYDHMGRRATKQVTVGNNVTLHQRYIYRGYLQVACIDLTRAAHPALWYITWESPRGLGGGLDKPRSAFAPQGRAGNGVPASQPTQPVATRPLAIQKDGTWYTYGWDLTKNICEVYGQHGYIRTAYTYAPYGQVSEEGDVEQNIQWSSEFNDTELGLIYYNYRHYNPTDGRWIGREPLTESIIKPRYVYIRNNPTTSIDIIGLVNCPEIPLPTPNQPSQCKPIVYIFIGGARDSEYGPMYECRLRSLGHCTKVCKTNDTKKCGCQVGPILFDGISVYYHWTSRDAILKDIRGYKRVCPHSRIVLLGHSYGGDTAMDVSERLENITNITLVTLDPVSDFDSYNWSNKRPSNIDYWINAYVRKGVFDLFSPVYGAGQAVSFVGTFLTTFSISNSIASGGGKWGHENAADVNIPFPLYGSIGHGDAYELLAPSTGERPIDYLNEFLILNIQL